MPDLPHMKSSAFPHYKNVNVYKYDNELDYRRYDYSQMDILVCNVPWDMGEAHIGNRTIDGIGNVVHFGTPEKRDAWFDAIPDSQCFRWTTKYRELHREQKIDVPLPFDVAARYNYVAVRYHLFANDDSPLQYENNDGLRRWFWFIREVEFVAPNTTRLHIMPDAWQTFIYDVEIPAMMLERGHAPVFDMSAEKYLSNPMDNCKGLLTEDANFGELSRVEHTDVLALNGGDMWCCIATTADAGVNDGGNEWGKKEDDDWFVNGAMHWTQDGAPNVLIIACEPSDFNGFLERVFDRVPQFLQTVKGVFFAPKNLIDVRGDAYTWLGTRFRRVNTNQKTIDFVQLDKAQFNYETEYANLAKLYTWPYAALEITDENGDTTTVRIEDTTGKIKAGVALNLVFPCLTASATLQGIGSKQTQKITFHNIGSHSFSFSGRWYEHLKEWDIPTFSVELQYRKVNDYATHFDRLQMANARDTAKANANASADTAYDNAKASATTSRSNTKASADTAYDNANASAKAARDTAKASADTAEATGNRSATRTKNNADRAARAAAYATKHNASASKKASKNTADANSSNAYKAADLMSSQANLQRKYNTSVQTLNKEYTNRDVDLGNAQQQANQAWDAGLSRALVNNELDAKQQSTSLANSVATANSVGDGIVSGVSSGITPVGMAVGGIVGGITGAIQGGVNSWVNNQQFGITANAERTKVDLIIQNQQNQLTGSSGNGGVFKNNQDRTDNTNDLALEMRKKTNGLSTDTTANSVKVAKGNADRTRKAAKDNANNIYTAIKESAENTRDKTLDSNAKSEATAKTNNAAVRRTAKTNADKMYTAATGNAGRSQKNTKDNADAVYKTETENAKRSYDTANANAKRDYDLATEAIRNQQRQAALRAPEVFGLTANADYATSKPMALFANVVTQDRNSIAQAGDEFLRYGYRYDRYYKFDGNWCRGKHFTYWKLNDFWVKNLNVPDMYMDRLRFFLFGGVTVWAKPEEIGTVSIYENGV